MKNTLFILSLLILFSSCSSFKNPQPIDGKKLSAIPAEWQGTYTFNEDSVISKYVIRENQIEIFDQRKIESPISNYSIKDGKHYISKVVMSTMENTNLSTEVNKIEEVYLPVFKNDSVFAFRMEHEKFEIGKNMVLMNCPGYYVLNLKFESWIPLLLMKNGSFMDLYSLNDKYLGKSTKDEDGTIIDDFTTNEFSAFVKKKSKYFETSSIRFDTTKKQMVNNPKNKKK